MTKAQQEFDRHVARAAYRALVVVAERRQVLRDGEDAAVALKCALDDQPDTEAALRELAREAAVQALRGEGVTRPRDVPTAPSEADLRAGHETLVRITRTRNVKECQEYVAALPTDVVERLLTNEADVEDDEQVLIHGHRVERLYYEDLDEPEITLACEAVIKGIPRKGCTTR